MTKKIPDSLTRLELLKAIAELDRGIAHEFGESIGYDVLFEGRRYAPKAVVGVAARTLLGTHLSPSDFKGGLGTKCFRILTNNGFTIVTKGSTNPHPNEVQPCEVYIEGSIQKVFVNRYERDADARAAAIGHHGLKCHVCSFDFEASYGTIGSGFIHVHHVVPLSLLAKSYQLDPIRDLRPVCPNCHAMLHKRIPPYTIDELRSEILTVNRLPERY